MAHRFSSVSWTQRVLAGFPMGMPGIGLEIEGAIQQAPQPKRHSIGDLFIDSMTARTLPPGNG